MCKVKAPDTSAQDAEAARQRQIEAERAAALAEQQRQALDAQRAADAARYEAMMNASNAQAQRQYDLLSQQLQKQADQQKQAYEEEKAFRDQQLAEQAARAERSRAYVTGRQELMDKYRSDVADAYAGFDDGFYQKFAQSFVDTYKPELARGYAKSKADTTYAFAKSGALRGSAANQSFADLLGERNKKEGAVVNAGLDNASSFRNDIDAQKNDALGLMYSSGAVGAEDLPDGITDVQSYLGGVGTQLGALTQTARNRAQTVRNPAYNLNGLDFSFSARTPKAA